MKSIITTLFAALLISGSSYAQERGPRQMSSPEQRVKNQVKRLTNELNLSKDQQDSIYKYSLEAAKQQQELMQNAGDNREGFMEKMRPIRENSTKKIKSFLNKEQQAKYEELQNQILQRRRQQ